jgi:8-oxo-dGTP diphosphatase
MRHCVPLTVHILFIKTDQLLMLRRYNTGFADGQYSVVAGHLEAGETVIQVAVREAWEEVGVKVLPEQLQVIEVMHRKSDDERVDFFVLAEDWQGEPFNREPHLCDDLRWSSLDQLPENTIPYVIRAVENFRKKQWFESFGW